MKSVIWWRKPEYHQALQAVLDIDVLLCCHYPGAHHPDLQQRMDVGPLQFICNPIQFNLPGQKVSEIMNYFLDKTFLSSRLFSEVWVMPAKLVC